MIIKKLEFYKEDNAQKYLSDIKAILTNSIELIDFILLDKLIKEAGLTSEWNAAQNF